MTFTSASSVNAFVDAVGADVAAKVPAASIGPMTTEAAREAGLDVVVEADAVDDRGVWSTSIAEHFAGTRSRDDASSSRRARRSSRCGRRARCRPRSPRAASSPSSRRTRPSATSDSTSRLSAIGAKGLFTKELEDDLADGRVHCCVHSLKDLPTEMPAGLEVVALLAARRSARRAARQSGDRREVARRSAARARASGRRACGVARSCSRCVAISRSSSCAATSRRAFERSTSGTSTPRFSPRPDFTGWASPTHRSVSRRAGVASGRGAGRDRDSDPRRRRGDARAARATRRRADDARHDRRARVSRARSRAAARCRSARRSFAWTAARRSTDSSPTSAASRSFAVRSRSTVGTGDQRQRLAAALRDAGRRRGVERTASPGDRPGAAARVAGQPGRWRAATSSSHASSTSN